MLLSHYVLHIRSKLLRYTSTSIFCTRTDYVQYPSLEHVNTKQKQIHVVMVTAWCEYTHQVSLGSRQQTDDHTALLDTVECTHPAGDDEDSQ